MTCSREVGSVSSITSAWVSVLDGSRTPSTFLIGIEIVENVCDVFGADVLRERRFQSLICASAESMQERISSMRFVGSWGSWDKT